MFQHLTSLFSYSEIARELGPDMVPKSWNSDYKENRGMCAEMILGRRENEKLDKASSGISIRLLLTNKSLHIYIYI